MDKEKKKIKEAAALKYTPGENAAPKIVALAKGDMAEKIVEKAVENEVPVYENAQLAHTLNALGIGDEIPPELYEVVAEILVFVGSIDNGYGELNGKRK
ncbi:MAG TPA: EscU/YscU/HrcU family type III secretion system export apparatus switch protein [Pseudobacteroides sp.]|nr:EscU/YscU/HrcU family type III secretion system export apparatus switch protein [Pseudobacteroides sp.]